jgi:hypothetical protein
MAHLPGDDLTRARAALIRLLQQIEHLNRALDDAQRIAQLVTQHGQELVLGIAGSFPRPIRPRQLLKPILRRVLLGRERLGHAIEGIGEVA